MSLSAGKGRSLRADLLMAAVVPLLLLAVGAIGIVYTTARSQREARVASKLETIASYLVSAAELGVVTQSADVLRDPVRRALGDPDVLYVAVHGSDGRPIVDDGSLDAPAVSLAKLKEAISGPRLRVLSSGYYELWQAARYEVDESGSEMLGFLERGSSISDPGRSEPHGYVRVAMSSERVDAQYRTMLVHGSFTVAVALVLGVAFALARSRASIQSLSLLCVAARRVGEGDLDVRIPSLGRGEIADLGAAFNEMSMRLHRAQEEISDHQTQLESRVEERTRELNLMRIEAERASRAKSHFLANMSHEIRTPMTAILGYADLVREDERVPKDLVELLDIVSRSGSHLLEIINGILDLSKIEEGRLELEVRPIDLEQLVRDVASGMRVRAQSRGIGLDIAFVSAIPPRILSDPVRIRQALINLMGNAVKFTERGGIEIRVGYDAAHERVEIEIEDTGIGVPEHLIPSLFLEFEQADTSTSRRFGGTGLGLAITRRIARLLGGDCMLRSSPGAGTTATLVFGAPICPDEVSDDRETGTLCEGGSAQLSSSDARADEPLRARILYAEDGPDNQRLVSTLLRKAGAEIEVVGNGRLAVERLRADDSFDVVLMDMAMPEMDGYMATLTLREMGIDIPIIAITAHALSGEREKCIAAGCDDYLSKPIDRRALIAAVRSALTQRRDCSLL